MTLASPGLRESGNRRIALAAIGGAAAALVPALLMWGFTVDDALISIRYAHHIATGVGYRFAAEGPSTDGVTPLPWPFLLAPFARGDALATLFAAKVIGTAAWTAAGAALGVRLVRMASLAATGIALFVVALAFPIGAWAASGMETGLATALATFAATSLDRPRRAALLAGLAASLRPEMAPWAVAIAIGASSSGLQTSGRDLIAGAAIAFAPFASCAAIRLVLFGRAAPLALLAKPSDLAHGAVYAAAACFAVLTSLFASLRGGRHARVVTIAFAVHVAAIVLAGGDWMPYARLLVPVAPSLAIAYAELFASAPALRIARPLAALVLGVYLAIQAAPAGRRVQADRADLIGRARPVLARSRVVAALDIGWVSASTDARIVDLAGLTDLQIASLGGGHTSKRVDTGMLLDRGTDTVLVYSDARLVEHRITSSELFRERFEKGETLWLGTRGAFYDVYRRRP